MRRDFYGKQLRQWRISLGIFCFAIFKCSIFFLALTENSSWLPSCLLTFKAPACVCSCSQGLEPQGLLWEGLTVGRGVFRGEAVCRIRTGWRPYCNSGGLMALTIFVLYIGQCGFLRLRLKAEHAMFSRLGKSSPCVWLVCPKSWRRFWEAPDRNTGEV